jgi:tetratricopeptide (TPR) repeat protein
MAAPPLAPAGDARLTLPQALALADQHRMAGRYAQAQDLCHQVLRHHPRNAVALHLLGVTAYHMGQVPAALDLMRQAVAARPDVAIYHSNLCEMYRLTGRLDDALAAGQQAVGLDPRSPQAHGNLGIVHYERDDYEAAIDSYQRAIALAPDVPQHYSNLGNAFRAIHRLEESIAAHQRAIALQPDFVDAYANLGSALHLIGRLDDAVAAFRHTIALAPQNGNAHHGLSIIMLLRGELPEGWDEYEWRWRSTEVQPRRLTGQEWLGEPLNGRRLLIHAEQGFGDVLHFCRYLPLFRERIGRALFLVPQALHGLMAATFPWLDVIYPGLRTTGVGHDVYTAVLSLPRLHRTTLATIPATVPYLAVPAAARQRWAERIGNGEGLRVGIVWAGNPKHINDLNRSLPLNALAPVLGVAGVRFFSLQVGGREREIERLPEGKVTDLAPELGDFIESAAAIAALDLVIAVDTSVAHLAGALGKPVWVMLPWVPDWRWLLDRSDSPWYPTMRLYRQPVRHDWTTVLQQVADDLAALAEGNRDRAAPEGAVAELDGRESA